jgi:hypothetical protein
MSIFAAFGAAPSNFTVPVTVAAVAGSIGADGVVAAGVGAAGCSSVVSFLPQPANRASPSKAGKQHILSQVLFFI